MKYLGNAFSLGMLDVLANGPVTLDVYQFTFDQACEYVKTCKPESIVGHADTAQLLSSMIGQKVEMRRVSTSLKYNDEVLVAQYNGPRLPEGATSLPEGAKIRWILVVVNEPENEFENEE